MRTQPEPVGDPGQPRVDRHEVLRLAVPAFLALVVEPLFLLTDSAIVGHLGTAPLAGLGVASAVLLTAVNIFVFLAYATTSVVARQLGAGDVKSALAAGIDGTWLAIGLGVVTAVVVDLGAGPLCHALGARGDTLAQAQRYLETAAYGIPGMLVVLATTGVLRGLQDTRTPLVVAVAGFGGNIVLNLWLVLGLGLGIRGSALGTALAQTGMGIALAAVLWRHARRHSCSIRPRSGGILTAARGGIPLLVRTLALRSILVLTTWMAAGFGVTTLAAHQVVSTYWSFLTFALDAIAIAGQAITGRLLGAGDAAAARAATRLMLRWGIWSGVVLGALTLVMHRIIPIVFTTDPAVRAAIAGALIVVAIQQPLSGYDFVADGVLIGAGDGRWLAGAMLVTLAGYLPIVAAVKILGSAWDAGPTTATMLIWAAMAGFMTVRGVLMWARLRQDGWLRLGAQPT